MSFFADFIQYFTQHVEVQDWVALIGLNITVVGLTSLAEKRTVIGVDYGRYLIDNYKIFGLFRVYQFLVAVALINALSLVVMLHFFSPVFDIIVFALLILSSWFVLTYLFFYVLRVHPRVKREIYKKQILGLYIKSDTECDFKGDRVVGMPHGDRTPKKISSNVQSFFNQYNEDTILAFEELFGPQSPVYARDRHSLKIWKQFDYGEPHDYQVKDSDCTVKINHISWEFFQMFRFSDIQERWLLEILKLFNGEYAKPYPRLRLYNVARVWGHVNRVGVSEGLWKYKFLDYMRLYTLEALCTLGDANSALRYEPEKYLHEQLAVYMQMVMKQHPTGPFEESVAKTFSLLLDIEWFQGVVSIEERYAIYSKEGEGRYKELLEEAMASHRAKLAEIKNIVFDFGDVLIDWDPEYLFKDYFKRPSQKKKFYAEVMNAEWIKEVDASATIDEPVNRRCQEFPRFKDALIKFSKEWEKTVDHEVPGMAKVVREVKKKYPVYGLSNWCKETFERVRPNYEVLKEIDNYVVSGGLKDDKGKAIPPKPSREIFEYFIKSKGLTPSSCFFIDDNKQNVKTARDVGMKAIHFNDALQIRKVLLK